MRIVQLIDSLNVGGAERLQVTFAETALAQGIRPTVMTIVPARVHTIVERLREMDLTVIEFNNGNLLNPWRFFSLILALRRGQFDLIHAHLEYSIILGAFAGFLTGIPVVATLHNIKSDRFQWLELVALRYGVKQILAVGNAVAESYERKLHGRPVTIVANPVKSGVTISAEERTALRKELSGDPLRPLLISVGRLEPQKGFSDLISTMTWIRKSHPHACLVIVGVGALMESLQKQIVADGLEDSVFLLGIRDNVPQLLAASDIYVNASHWEGMPISILEAMQAGLPIVATKVGDIPYILQHGRGLLVPPSRPNVLADALQTLLSNPSLCQSLGSNGRSYVAHHHNANIWLDKLIEIYQNVKGTK